MFSRYRDILALPGAKAFFWWGLVARIQMGMTGLATFLLVQIEYGSYATAGLVVAVLALGFAFISPQVSRLVDTYGQARVLRPGFAIAIVARVGLVLAALNQAPVWVLIAIVPFLAAAGTQSTLSRARWTHVVPDKHALNSAFSLESSLEEVLFISGPALATILATQVASWVPSIVAVTTMAIGGYVFLSLRDTEPPARKASGTASPQSSQPAPKGRRKGALRGHLLATTPALVITSIIFATQGALFASADASTVALAEELGLKAWSGPVLAVFALGSLTGGLLYGTRVWNGSLASRLLWGVTASGLGAMTFWLAPNLVVLGALMFITGLAIAPTMAVGDGVVHALVPRNRVTEGMSWTRVGMDAGIAAGAWGAGTLIDSRGAVGGFTVVAIAGAVGIVLMASSWRYLRNKRAYEEQVSLDPEPTAA
jgi:MFS family permease